MTAIYETAYPRLRSDWTTQQLIERFTPTEEELAFAKHCTRQVLSCASVLTQLKIFQYLGRFITINPEVLKQLAPYRIQHINRFGSYTLNLDKPIEPLVEEKDFELKLKSIKSRFKEDVYTFCRISG